MMLLPVIQEYPFILLTYNAIQYIKSSGKGKQITFEFCKLIYTEMVAYLTPAPHYDKQYNFKAIRSVY